VDVVGFGLDRVRWFSSGMVGLLVKMMGETWSVSSKVSRGCVSTSGRVVVYQP
jgi:hypothetical protein